MYSGSPSPAFRLHWLGSRLELDALGPQELAPEGLPLRTLALFQVPGDPAHHSTRMHSVHSASLGRPGSSKTVRPCTGLNQRRSLLGKGDICNTFRYWGRESMSAGHGMLPPLEKCNKLTFDGGYLLICWS